MKKKITILRFFIQTWQNSANLSFCQPQQYDLTNAVFSHVRTQRRALNKIAHTRKAAATQKRKRPHPCDLFSNNFLSL